MTDKLADRVEALGASSVPRCSDFDDDCESIPDKVRCWLYDPAKGACPYLRSKEDV